MGCDEAVDALSVHEVGAHEAGEGERGYDGFLRGLGEAEEQIGDQGDGDLDAHGIFADAEEVLDLEVLLDPPEEQLDGPAPLVEIGRSSSPRKTRCSPATTRARAHGAASPASSRPAR